MWMHGRNKSSWGLLRSIMLQLIREKPVTNWLYTMQKKFNAQVILFVWLIVCSSVNILVRWLQMENILPGNSGIFNQVTTFFYVLIYAVPAKHSQLLFHFRSSVVVGVVKKKETVFGNS